MIYSDTKTQSEIKTQALHTERNTFGYLVNVVLATGWFSLFLVLSGSIITDIKSGINPIHYVLRIVLVLDSLLLGGFHSYVLHCDSYEKTKKKRADLIRRIMHSWPLVFGTVLYAFVACIEVWKTKNCDRVSNTFVYSYEYSHYKLICLLLYLNIPLTVCAVFLAKDSYWNIFSAWTLNDSESAEIDEAVPEFRVARFIVSIILAFVWFVLALVPFLVLIFAVDARVDMLLDNNIIMFCTHICSLVVFVIHVYDLFQPKYDSDEEFTWKIFVKKNWLLVSACSLVLMACLLFSVHEAVILFIILSLCSCSIMLPSKLLHAKEHGNIEEDSV